MKSLRFLIIITVIIALGFLVSSSFAQEKKEEAAQPAATEKTEPAKAEKAEPAKAKKPAMPSVKGEVASVDAAANTVVVKDAKGTEVKLEVSSETSIEKGKKKLTIGDLKVGEKVTAKYSEAEGKMVAKSIRVHVPKAAKAKHVKAEAAKTQPAKEEPAKEEPAKAEPEQK